MVSPLNLPAPAAVGDEWGNALNAGVQAVNADVETLKGRLITAGTGLLGGGSLAANRSLSVDFASSADTAAGKVVQANDTRLSDARAPKAHTHVWADTTDKPATFPPAVHTHAQADVTNLVTDLAAKAPASRLITAGAGLVGGGSLDADRTLAVDWPAAASEIARSPGNPSNGVSTKPARIDHVHPVPAVETIGVAAGQIVLGPTVSPSGEGVYAHRSGGVVTLGVYISQGTSGTVLTMPAGWRPNGAIRGSMTISTAQGGTRAVLLGTEGNLTVEGGLTAQIMFGHLTYVCNRT